jgi:tetratricopeptide (TPR) repeat protein
MGTRSRNELQRRRTRDFATSPTVAWHCALESTARARPGSCLVKLGELPRALEAFQASIQAEREFPGMHSAAYLDYAEIVLLLDRRDLYEDALDQLSEHESTAPFPFLQYRSGAAAAFLCERLGRTAEARAAAARALSAAAKTESPFRSHRRLGLVKGRDAGVDERLWRLAHSSSSEQLQRGR